MAKRGPKKGHGGRPLIPIDWNLAESLAHIQCTGEEIASILGIHYETLNERCKREFKLTFPEWFKKYSSKGKISLRRAMWKMATDARRPNVGMAIWLSKQYLGMTDKVENTQLVELNEVPTVNLVFEDDQKNDDNVIDVEVVVDQ